MTHSKFRVICCFLSLFGFSATSAEALAEEESRWLLQTSIYTIHFNPDPAHINNQKLLNLEYQRADRWLFGAAVFDNSFGQTSQYAYFGKLWRPFDSQPLVHTKLTGGLMHGYKDEYQSKIPFNSSGTAPVIIPAIGVSGRHLSGEAALLGGAGLMLTVGVLF